MNEPNTPQQPNTPNNTCETCIHFISHNRLCRAKKGFAINLAHDCDLWIDMKQSQLDQLAKFFGIS